MEEVSDLQQQQQHHYYDKVTVLLVLSLIHDQTTIIYHIAYLVYYYYFFPSLWKLSFLFSILKSPEVFENIDVDLNHINTMYPDYNQDFCSKYYDYSKLDSTLKNSNCFSVIHFNICSLYPKLDELRAELSLLNYNFDVIHCTESWLTPQTKDLVSIESYNSFHNLREDRRGGGVSIFVLKKFSVVVLSQLTVSNVNIESLFVEIDFGSMKVLTGSIYRPPRGNSNDFMNCLIEMFESINRNKYREIIIVGDFNYDLTRFESDQNVQYFLDTIQSHSLFPLISKPTRITDNTASLLDNILITRPVDFIAGIILSTLSDHFPVFCSYNNFFDNHYIPPQIFISYREVNQCTLQLLYDALQLYDFSSVYECGSVDDAVVMLDNIIFERYDKLCPIIKKSVSPKKLTKPWICQNILSLIRKRQNLFVLLKRNKVSKLAYNRYKNFVTKTIRDAKEKYFEKKFSDFKSDAKKTWKLINGIFRPGSYLKNDAIDHVIVNDVKIYDKYEMATAFNEYFVNIGSNIAQSVHSQPDDHKRYLRGNYPNSFYFSPVSSHEINSVICSLKNKQSSINCTPTKVLKYISKIIAPVLCHIINHSIQQGVFPDSLKIANVIPIFKSNVKTNIQNYRPISLLPLLSKIFEKVAHKQLYNYL